MYTRSGGAEQEMLRTPKDLLLQRRGCIIVLNRYIFYYDTLLTGCVARDTPLQRSSSQIVDFFEGKSYQRRFIVIHYI